MTRSEIIGANIRKLRNEHGMTQIQFASEIDRSQSVVAQYERGQRMPSTEIIAKIASVFGVTSDSIYYSKEEIKEASKNEDWYGDYFGYGEGSNEAESVLLQPDELYLIQCYRAAERSAQMYALQMLENNPVQVKKGHA